MKNEEKQKIKRKTQESHPVISAKKTSSEKAADLFTKWIGSWTFIFLSIILIAGWMAVNIYGWINRWDPYPFILLNLVLSTLAAIQAPIILMSQNRTSKKDRIHAEYDYAVNRKAEREIESIQNQLNRIEQKLQSKKR